jgi:hypothetical protein
MFHRFIAFPHRSYYVRAISPHSQPAGKKTDIS